MFNIINITECDSTNAYLSREIINSPLPEWTVISTSFQTKGRGQLTNVWESQKGENILCSILLRPEQLPIKSQFLISQAISVAIVEVLNSYADGFKIKWPNDIYYKEKKIAGILIENTLSSKGLSTCIIGLGLNVNQSQFYSDAPNPISLSNIISKNTNPQTLLKQILDTFASIYQWAYSDVERLREQYFNLLLFNGQMRKYSDANGEFLGKIIDVENDGHLIIEDMEGHKRRYAFKEIQFKREQN